MREAQDAYTREMLAIEVDPSLPGLRVIRVLEHLRVERGYLRRSSSTTARSLPRKYSINGLTKPMCCT